MKSIYPNKYQIEPILRPNQNFKKHTDYQTEKLDRPDIKFIPKRKLENDKIEYCEKQYKRDHKFELDLFQLEDYEFMNWANSQPPSLIIAIMAEMKKSNKLRPEIEILRTKIKDIPLISIEEYRKRKCLGERTVSFLRQLKHKYGNNILKILYLTSES